MEELRGITWDLWGEELNHEQAIQRIVNAGFPVAGGIALTMFAIVEGESGEYQRAWHINVERNPDGTISRFGSQMKVKSIDLGFMQFNVAAPRMLDMTKEAVTAFVEEMFDLNPDLADPHKSAERAYRLYLSRGFSPWYAYKPGTDAFWQKKRYGAVAFANWHLHSYVGRKDRFTNKKLELEFRE